MNYQYRYRRKSRIKWGNVFLTLAVLVTLIIAIVAFVNRVDVYEFHETTYHRVAQGETLWNIAQQHSDNRHDTRRVVWEIQQLSDTTALIFPGDLLIIPVFEVMREN
jgi:nucleoid-associated protein YgaU